MEGTAARAMTGFVADDWSFESVANAHSRRLFGIALAILRDRGEAEDAVQETLWKAWKARERSPGPEDMVGPWLVRICINHCLDRRSFLTRRGFRRHGGDDDLSRVGAPAIQFEGQNLDIDRAFAGLSRRQRAAITLHYHYGYSLDECAHLMNCGYASVRTHINRGVATMRKELSHG